ncbi:MAG: hypothetical protein HY513_04090 [Candidatus Aenigmarchaeota archaeon]|nr:hypothetical protein [Candidatus Aenigmarchaeota archaeon]
MIRAKWESIAKNTDKFPVYSEREYCGFDLTVFMENPQRSSPHIGGL